MKTLIPFFVLLITLTSNGQAKNNNSETNLITTYPKIYNREIPKIWKSRNVIQKDWIKIEKDKNGYLIYHPCDGKTETIKLEGSRLTINWRLEESQKFELEKFTRLTKNNAFRADAYDFKNKIGFEINAKIVDFKNGIVLWEFNGNKWLMTPKENIKAFRIIKNNCKTAKKKELVFLPIENY